MNGSNMSIFDITYFQAHLSAAALLYRLLTISTWQMLMQSMKIISGYMYLILSLTHKLKCPVIFDSYSMKLLLLRCTCGCDNVGWVLLRTVLSFLLGLIN